MELDARFAHRRLDLGAPGGRWSTPTTPSHTGGRGR